MLPKNDSLNLCLDISNDVTIDEQFTLSCSDTALGELEDLVMIVKYN